ncbi:MAG: class I SAM-dependent methyltransferase [Candidatus Omnitrophica bacterium]|nr:class I SAM-dependent methyltransferase [Candidatus Omnitrophota bacterium]
MDKLFNSMRYSADEDYLIGDSAKRIQILLNLIGKNKKVLDLGCGDGLIAGQILKNGNEVAGVEVSEFAIKKAREKGIKVYDYDLNSDWGNSIKEKFDLVLCGEIIEHIFDTDKLLHNIYSVLKEGGLLVLSTPNLAALGRRVFLLFGINPLTEVTARRYDSGHIRYFTLASLKKLLKENGFIVTKFKSDYVSFYTKGRLRCGILADLFPAIGNSLIVKCKKIPLP